MDGSTKDEEKFPPPFLICLSFPLREYIRCIYQRYIRCKDVAISYCDQRCLSRSPAQRRKEAV